MQISEKYLKMLLVLRLRFLESCTTAEQICTPLIQSRNKAFATRGLQSGMGFISGEKGDELGHNELASLAAVHVHCWLRLVTSWLPSVCIWDDLFLRWYKLTEIDKRSEKCLHMILICLSEPKHRCPGWKRTDDLSGN